MNPLIKKLQLSLIHDTNHITDAYPRKALARFNAEAYVQTAKRDGFTAVFFSAKDLWGRHFYPTKLGPVYTRCQPDVFGQVARACHKRGVALVAYYCVAFDRDAMKAHPEWRMVTHDRQPVLVCRTPTACMNSPYLEERVLPALREITRKYRPQAFWLDHIWAMQKNCCWCDYCRKAYEKETGRRRPQSPTHPGIDDYRYWIRHRPALWAEKITRAIHEIDPTVVTMVNYAFSIRHPQSRPDWCRLISLDVLEPRDCIHLINPIHARWLSSMQTPWQFMITNMIDWWGSWNPKPPEELHYQLGVIQAHGGGVCFGYFTLPEGSDSSPAGRNRHNADVVTWIRRHTAPESEDAKPFRDVAILHSIAGLEARADERPSLPEHTQPIFGAARILSNHHIDADIVNEELLEAQLSRYGVVILPEVAALEASTVDRLARFVSEGGRLIATGALPFTSTTLAKLFGVKKQVKRLEDFWYADLSAARLGRRLEYEVPTSWADVIWSPRLDGGKAAGCIIAPCPGYDNKAVVLSAPPPPDRPTAYPAMVIHRAGKGKAVWINGELCARYWQTSIPALSHVLADMVHLLYPERILSVKNGGPLEFSLLREANRFFLHMVNFAAERHPARSPEVCDAAAIAHIIRPVPVRNVTVTLRLPSSAKEAYLHPGKKRIPLSRRGRTVSLTVPEVTDHAVLEVVTSGPAHSIRRVTKGS